MPKTLNLITVASVVLLLGACQSAPTPKDNDKCIPTEPGSASEQVDVSGGALAEPKVAFPDGVSTDKTERSVIDGGDGRVAEEGSLVTFAYVAFNGSTGEAVDSIGYEDSNFTQATIDEKALMPGLAKALLCGEPGTRIAAVIPPKDAFGETGNEQYGISASDSIVFVIDVVAVAAERADGKKQPAAPGMPLVELDGAGEPTITIPAADPPAELQIAVLKKGSGAEVKEGATVTIEYTGVLWGTGETFDSSWPRAELVQLPTTNFVPGFGTALVGQTVGSQIEVIIPPELGYGEDGNLEAGISGTDTMVFVVDILAVI